MTTGEPISDAPLCASYYVRERIRDGREITIRAVNSFDKEALRNHFASLSAESRYLRFFGIRNLFTPQELSRLTELDFVGSAGLVAIESDAGSERIVGVAHYLNAGVPGEAEFACDVNDEYHQHGIATLLLEHLARIARSNGISALDADILGSNRQMLKVFADSGFDILQSNDSGVVRITMSTSENARHMEAREKRTPR